MVFSPIPNYVATQGMEQGRHADAWAVSDRQQSGLAWGDVDVQQCAQQYGYELEQPPPLPHAAVRAPSRLCNACLKGR
jgi:hypothetical protein